MILLFPGHDQFPPFNNLIAFAVIIVIVINNPPHIPGAPFLPTLPCSLISNTRALDVSNKSFNIAPGKAHKRAPANKRKSFAALIIGQGNTLLR